MENYMENWNYLNRFIEQKIRAMLPSIKAYFGEITETDGFLCSIKLASSETGVKAFEGIPILQSKYHSPITMKGDFGIIINLQQDISPLLNSMAPTSLEPQNYYAFLPLIKKADYKGENKKQRLSSPDLKTFIEIGDDGYTIETAGKAEITIKETMKLECDKAITIKTKDKLEVEATGAINVKSNDNVKVEGMEISIKGQTAFKAEGVQVSIKGTSPVELAGPSASIGQLVGDLAQALLTAAPVPAAPGAPIMPSAIATFTNVLAQCKANFK